LGGRHSADAKEKRKNNRVKGEKSREAIHLRKNITFAARKLAFGSKEGRKCFRPFRGGREGRQGFKEVCTIGGETIITCS